MTIILSISDERNPIHLLSDILLSAKGVHDIKIRLPHARRAERALAGGSTIAGFAQKTIVLGRTAALFAGDVEIAHKILDEFFSKSKGGDDYVALGEVIRAMELTEEQRSKVAFLTFYCKDKNNNLITCGYNIFYTYKVSLGDGHYGKIQTVGSGSEDFVLNYNATRNKGVILRYELYIDIIHRLLLRTVEPFIGRDDVFENLYGSWFELSVFIGNKFEKIPIALKFWYKKPGEQSYDEFGPLIYSNYVHDDLFLTTVRSNDSESHADVIRVKDFLDRGSDIDNWSPQQVCDALDFKPKLFVQVLVKGTDADCSLQIQPYFINGDPLMTVERTAKSESTFIAKVTIDKQLKDLVNRESNAELSVDFTR